MTDNKHPSIVYAYSDLNGNINFTGSWRGPIPTQVTQYVSPEIVKNLIAEADRWHSAYDLCHDERMKIISDKDKEYALIKRAADCLMSENISLSAKLDTAKEALEWIVKPGHDEPDDYTRLACAQHRANEALEKIKDEFGRDREVSKEA